MPCKAQSQELLDRIKIHKQIIQLYIEGKYDSVITIGTKAPPRDSVYLYSCNASISKAFFETGDTTNGLKYLLLAIEGQELSEVDNVTYNYKKYNLDSNDSYQKILRNFDLHHDKYAPRFNYSVLAKCLEIMYTDSRLRNAEFAVWSDSTNREKVLYTMHISDSMNVVKMKELLHDIGRYPGISDIGITNSHYFQFIVAHMANKLNYDTLYTFLRTATLNGQVPNYVGPHILDKMRFYAGKEELLFGEFGNHNDYKDDVYHYRPIKDIEYVDARRAQFLLPPLYEAAKNQKCVLPPGYDPATQKPLKD